MVELSSPHLDRMFHALAQPIRRQLLAELAEGEKTVNQLAEPFDVSLAAVSKHIKVLEAADLVSQTRVGRRHICRINAQPFAEMRGVIQYYEAFWEGVLGSLARLLEESGSPPPRAALPKAERSNAGGRGRAADGTCGQESTAAAKSAKKSPRKELAPRSRRRSPRGKS